MKPKVRTTEKSKTLFHAIKEDYNSQTDELRELREQAIASFRETLATNSYLNRMVRTVESIGKDVTGIICPSQYLGVETFVIYFGYDRTGHRFENEADLVAYLTVRTALDYSLPDSMVKTLCRQDDATLALTREYATSARDLSRNQDDIFALAGLLALIADEATQSYRGLI